MYKCEVAEIINWFHNNYQDEVIAVHKVEANSKENLFKKVYAFERGARYDNARRYRIIDRDLYNEYQNWKVNGVTIELFYGGATVD